ncbi:hypothetical protein [Nonomuraea sp. B19D2]|uniref:hypothetical protein n=1 Tax=Nonomuraea sp. B19D2 TaxID=3159561 RepID=UPI0032DA9DB3
MLGHERLQKLLITRQHRRARRGGDFLNHLDNKAVTKQCPECLTDIPAEARRCAACTAELVPDSEKPR